MTREELLEIIEKAVRDGRTELDLYNKYIESLPAEIGKLRPALYAVIKSTRCLRLRRTANTTAKRFSSS